MKLIDNSVQKVFDVARPLFSTDGKLAKAGPWFEAMENFFFWSNERTPNAPHAPDPLDIRRFMSMVIIGLLPCLFAAFYLYGWRALAVIIVSYTVGGTVEVICACIRKEEINEGFLVTGLLFPLVLPPTLPLWMVGVGVAFGVLVGKEIFGGTGRNLFNPTIIGRCFLFLAYPTAMTTQWIDPAVTTGGLRGFGQWLNVDAITSATPLSQAPDVTSIWNLLIGNVPGTLGGTCSLAIIIGGVFLLTTRVANYRCTIGMIGGFAILGAIMNALGQFGPVGWNLLAGGFLFGAFFMATDPVSAPSTNPARWMYGILIGVLTLLMRNLTPLPEGVMFSILLGNVFAPVLDEMVIRTRMRRLARER